MSSSKASVLATPSDRRALIAIDLGAESCRVSLLRWLPTGPHFHLVHRFANHVSEREDGVHWDMTCILDGLNTGLRQCAETATEGIRSIAVDGWAVDYVWLDKSGAAIGDPFCYRDERTIAAEQALHERLSAERMRDLTGIQLLRLNTVYQMFADEPARKNLRWLNLPEFVLYSLGARQVSERTRHRRWPVARRVGHAASIREHAPDRSRMPRHSIRHRRYS
jgi:rhamnulokinase